MVLNSIPIFREVTSGRSNSRLHILNFCSVVANPAELSILTVLIGVTAAETVGSCVDGLQRTTAIMRFINNEIPAFGCYYKDFEDRLPMEIDVLVNINEL